MSGKCNKFSLKASQLCQMLYVCERVKLSITPALSESSFLIKNFKETNETTVHFGVVSQKGISVCQD